MNRLARACLASLVAFNLVIFHLAPVAHAEEMTSTTVTEPPVSQYATASVDTDCIVDGPIQPNGEYNPTYLVNTVQYYNVFARLKDYDAVGRDLKGSFTGVKWEFTDETFVSYSKRTKSCLYFLVPEEDGFSVYKCDNGRVISIGKELTGKFYGSVARDFFVITYPVFTSKEAGEYFYLNKKLQNENDLITAYLPDGYSFNETLGLVKSSSSSVEVGSYDENIGYPINFDYKGNLLSMNTARSSTWDFYKDANGNAITRTAEEEKYNIEIFLNFDLKNDVMNNFANGFSTDLEELQMPARALSYFDGPANSCSCIYENWGLTMERAFQYFRDKGSLKMNDFLATNTYYFNTKNLNVWARYYYLDGSGEKHYGDWVKWSKEGLSVVHEDTSSGSESTVEDAVPFGPEYKSSYLEKEEGYDADEQKITIDGITINVSPYFESQEEDPEYYPTETDSPSGDDPGGSGSGEGGSSGSGGSGSGIFGTIGELLGNLLSGIVDLITGLLKGLSSAIYKIVKSIKEFFSDISGAGDIFGELFAWLPGEVTVLLSLSFVVAIICRLTGR